MFRPIGEVAFRHLAGDEARRRALDRRGVNSSVTYALFCASVSPTARPPIPPSPSVAGEGIVGMNTVTSTNTIARNTKNER
jgi:hypothetical protein